MKCIDRAAGFPLPRPLNLEARDFRWSLVSQPSRPSEQPICPWVRVDLEVDERGGRRAVQQAPALLLARVPAAPVDDPPHRHDDRLPALPDERVHVEVGVEVEAQLHGVDALIDRFGGMDERLDDLAHAGAGACGRELTPRFGRRLVVVEVRERLRLVAGLLRPFEFGVVGVEDVRLHHAARARVDGMGDVGVKAQPRLLGDGPRLEVAAALVAAASFSKAASSTRVPIRA